jgi:hypothetical protein
MAEYRLEKTELVLNDDIEKALARFNEKITSDPETFARAIAFTALGYRDRLDENEQEFAQVAADVLDKTTDGTRLDASEATWAAIFSDPDHRIARADVLALDEAEDASELKIALRRRGFCALRAIALQQLRAQDDDQQLPALEDVRKEIENANMLVSA